MTARRRLIRGSAWIGALIFLVAGAWAFFAPHSFFEVVARYPPYNRHLFHDLGAFQLGIAAALLAGIGGRSVLGVAMWAGAVGASAHAVSHWIDAHLGGRAIDAPVLTILAGVLVTGLVLAESDRRELER